MRVLFLLSALGLLADSAEAQHGFWQPDDRVLISAFHNARGIATDQRYVYISTANGLEIYDQTFRRWLLPSTIEDGYPTQFRPGRIAYDPRERGIWLVTDAQQIFSWSPDLQRWQQRSEFDVPDDVRSRLQRGPNISDPAFAIMRNFAGRDAAGRTWQVTGIEPAERSGTYWAATYGGNFSFVDTRNLSAESFSYGTLSRGVSAITLDAGGNLYFGSDGIGARTGISRADSTLQQWQQYEARVADAPQRRVYDLVAAPNTVYAASVDGVFAQRGNRWQRIAEGDARALAHFDGRTWVGTRGTLGWLDAEHNFTRAEFPVQTVHSFAQHRDTLWMGAETGLYRLAGGGFVQVGGPFQAIGIGIANQVFVVLTPRALHTWDGTQLSLPLRNPSLQRIGAPSSITAIGDRIYVGGAHGIAEWDTTTDRWRHLTTPSDIPEGPVYDIIEENGRLWLATPAGALRLQWK